MKKRFKTFSLENFFANGTCISLERDECLIGFGKVKKYAEPPQNHLPFFFLYSFFLSDPLPFLQYEFMEKISLKNLREIFSLKETVSPKTIAWEPLDKKSFSESFFSLKKSFAKGFLEKGVPYSFATSKETFSFSQFVQSFNTLVDYVIQTPGCYLYGFWNENEGILGATPELLFTFDENSKRLTTLACAATVLSNEKNLNSLKSSKMQNEHHLVIKGIEETLAPFGKIEIQETKAVSFGVLSHTITPIFINLKKDNHWNSLIPLLHPTPALGTYPQKKGIPWLLECNKKEPRGYFGAPIGVFLPQDRKAYTYVAIRNVQWRKEGMKIGAGCGVVKESLLEEEWKEFKQKIFSVQKILSL